MEDTKEVAPETGFAIETVITGPGAESGCGCCPPPPAYCEMVPCLACENGYGQALLLSYFRFNAPWIAHFVYPPPISSEFDAVIIAADQIGFTDNGGLNGLGVDFPCEWGDQVDNISPYGGYYGQLVTDNASGGIAPRIHMALMYNPTTVKWVLAVSVFNSAFSSVYALYTYTIEPADMRCLIPGATIPITLTYSAFPSGPPAGSSTHVSGPTHVQILPCAGLVSGVPCNGRSIPGYVFIGITGCPSTGSGGDRIIHSATWTTGKFTTSTNVNGQTGSINILCIGGVWVVRVFNHLGQLCYEKTASYTEDYPFYVEFLIDPKKWDIWSGTVDCPGAPSGVNPGYCPDPYIMYVSV